MSGSGSARRHGSRIAPRASGPVSVAAVPPPVLVATGQHGVMASAGGFDIYSILRKDVTVTQRALGSLWVDGRAELYSIDLLTGRAYLLGEIGATVVDIAVPLNQF